MRPPQDFMVPWGSEYMERMLYLWLDDIRLAPDGWTHVRTVEQAKAALLTGTVVKASLDHDLGCCADCLNGMSPDEWLEKNNYQSMPHCEHFGPVTTWCAGWRRLASGPRKGRPYIVLTRLAEPE